MSLHILIYKKNANSNKKKKICFWSWHVSFFPFFFFHYFDQILKSLTFQNPLPSLIAPHPPNPPLAPAQATAAPISGHCRPQLRKLPPLTSWLRRPLTSWLHRPFINSPPPRHSLSGWAHRLSLYLSFFFLSVTASSLLNMNICVCEYDFNHWNGNVISGFCLFVWLIFGFWWVYDIFSL